MNNEIHVRSRKSGQSNEMILSMIPDLLKGEKVGVCGCEDPKDIIERLEVHGVKAKSEPMYTTQPIKAIYNSNSIEGEIIGFKNGEKRQTGYLFFTETKGL